MKVEAYRGAGTRYGDEVSDPLLAGEAALLARAAAMRASGFVGRRCETGLAEGGQNGYVFVTARNEKDRLGGLNH
jgi:hypothetical protein